MLRRSCVCPSLAARCASAPPLKPFGIIVRGQGNGLDPSASSTHRPTLSPANGRTVGCGVRAAADRRQGACTQAPEGQPSVRAPVKRMGSPTMCDGSPDRLQQTYHWNGTARARTTGQVVADASRAGDRPVRGALPHAVWLSCVCRALHQLPHDSVPPRRRQVNVACAGDHAAGAAATAAAAVR